MMDARGLLDSERAPISPTEDLDFGPMYQRSLPLSTVFVKVPPETRPTWFATAQLNSGYFDFDPYAEDGVIKSVRCKGDYFDAYTLLKANNAEDGDCSFLVEPNFYPALHKMLRQRKDWGEDFRFRGQATFEHGILEWTKVILQNYKETLHQAGIFGAVAVSCYPYEHCNNVWRAFCELWGPLTNTFHHAGGEMSVSLYDLNIIGGLPISGKPYEEFTPPNAALLKAELYPATVAELLRIYSHLCKAYKSHYVYWPWWTEHFYRGPVIYGAYGDCKHAGASTLKKPRLELQATKDGELAAFLAFWLSRFVLPSRSKKIRPETFYMASLMAEGVRVSLAPTVLGYIYHGLGEMATHPEGPGSSDSCLPIHYVIGWLGEYFPYLYSSRSDRDFPAGYPRLARYAGVQGRVLNITAARMVFRTDRSVVNRPISVFCDEDRILLDDDKLPDSLFEVLVSMRSAVLPVRVGEDFFLEPYYPNRFARQFGLDQSVPSNKLCFAVSERRKCGVEDLLRAQMTLYRKNTTSRFFIPRSSRLGRCSWWYCRWWLRSCTPYLGLSITTTFETLNQRPPPDGLRRVFVIKNSREDSTGLRQEVKISEVRKPALRSSERTRHKSLGNNTYQRVKRTLPTSDEGGRKKLKSVIVADDTIIIPEKSFRDNERELNVCAPLRITSPDKEFEVALNPFAEPEKVVPAQNLEDEPGMQFAQNIEGEPGMQTACFSDASSNQAPSLFSSLEKAISDLLGSELPNFKKSYIIAEIMDICTKVSSSSTPKVLLAHVPDISSSLDMLRPAIKFLKAGKLQFEKFVAAIEQILKVADQTSATTEVLEQQSTMDAEIEECEKFRKTLVSHLVNASGNLEILLAEESDIKAEEERIQKRRSEYVTKRQTLESSMQSLKVSLKEQEEKGQKLQEERSAYISAKLPEIEQAKASFKSETEAYQNLADSLLPMFHEDNPPVVA